MTRGSRTAFFVSTLLLGVGVYPGSPLCAQVTPAPAGAAAAAEGITAAELARHLAVLAHDSLHDRVAPSPGLEQAAQYVAAQFAAFGLRPGLQVPDRPVWEDADLSWLLRYPMPGQRRVDYTQSYLTFTSSLHRGATKILSEQGQPVTREVRVSFATLARFAGSGPMRSHGGDFGEAWSVVLVAGPQTAATVAKADLRGTLVLYVPPRGPGVDTSAEATVRQALAAQSHGVVVLRETDSLRFAAAARAAQAAPVRLVDDYLSAAATGPWVAEVWPGALRELLDMNGVDLAELGAARAPLVRPLPFLQGDYQAAALEATVDSSATLPLVLGTLEGSDSVLRREYVVVVAHLDQNGRQRVDSSRRTSTTEPGADDNASGVAALLELAQAFSQPGARPKRSLVFLATTDGPEFWGSSFFANRHFATCVLAVALDRLGGAGAAAAGDAASAALVSDALFVDGAGELTLQPSPAWVAAAHPELGLTVVDTGTVFQPTGSHYAFIHGLLRRIPSLSVHAGPGTHEPLPSEAPGAAAAVDPGPAARRVRLVYHLLRALGDAPRRPRWNAVGQARAHAGVGEP